MSYLIFYALGICCMVLFREHRQKSTLDRFLVADRNVGGLFGSMSIAASWIWAPAIFISSQTGFTFGISGLVWFCIPNMAALFIFAPFAAKVRKALPEGYNYIEYLKKSDKSFAHTQLYLQLVMQIVIFAIQLVAGAELLANLTGSNYKIMVIGMALTPFCYTFFSGLRTSIFTDAMQYIVIAMSALLLMIFFPGHTHNLTPRPFEPFHSELLFNFGISSALGLTVAIFADHQQWQRAFAIKETQIIRTFNLAGLMHGFATITLGMIGCFIFSEGFKPQNIDLVGFEYIKTYYHPMFISIFVIMAMCALISTLDSGLCAFSSLMMKEFNNNKVSLKQGRMWMGLLAVFGMTIGMIHPSLLTLWFIASTIRLSSFLPTVLSITLKTKPTFAYTVATIGSLLSGGSVFAAGILLGNNYIRTTGMVLVVLLSGLILLGARLRWK